MIYRKYIKRLIDIILAFIGIVLLSPIFIILIIWIKLDSEGPVLFKQRRIGKGKSEFYILKFRTMKIDTPNDMPTHLLINAESYITRAGKFLRKTSLDELPQILNILKGEMSIIGPRPALWNQYDLIKERDKYSVNGILPGLTGWAQVNGRDELPIDIKARLDGEYIKNISFALDLKIFLKTIFNVLRSEGIVEGNRDKNSTTKV
ncbi:sugar transferase [Neobacillus cucumis]|uniref:sugar transferase n=1 Tax=Neobacillus cucumis TaxID=1740721 RepID=UPI0018DF5705|nr:sugar transferase [Neobacillus cucumis]MBI0577961.1 sugar transferase [Neobacillus cucumis]